MPGKHHLRGFKIAKSYLNQSSPSDRWSRIALSRCQENYHLRGFKIAKKNRLAAKALWSITVAHSRCQENITYGGSTRSPKKNRLAASRLVDNRLHCVSRCRTGKHHLRGFKIAKKSASPLRGSWTMVSIAQENITYGGSK